jgi:phosphoribosylanthranilate isomerase
VLDIARNCDLDCVQLHGEESPQAVDLLMDSGLSIIRALRVRDRSVLHEFEKTRATYYLLDSYVPGRAGGTGHTFDWTVAREAPQGARVLLAGGLTPENVVDAIRTAQPWGVDVSSGVEADPGRKDHDKVRRFVAAAKGTAVGGGQ